MILLLASLALSDDVVRGQIDWQAHPAMHITWPGLFCRGLTDRSPRRTWRHRFRQVVYTPYVDASGVRIHLWAAMAAEKARDPAQARRLILRQLDFIEDWVEDNSDRYALARSAAEAREILGGTDKDVVVLSIEGGRELLRDPADAAFWRAQGVALVTLLHLYDDELGAAAINPGWTGPLVNRRGARKRRRGEPRGLTERGREAIVELADAGILVDLTHMAPQAVQEALEVTGAEGIPPVVTHGMVGRLQPTSERAFSDDRIVEIYRQGGVFNLVLSGTALVPEVEVAPRCPGTLHEFRLHWEALRDVVEGHAPEILGVAPGTELTEAHRVRLATGWASDWNGWTNHSRPVYGREGCLTDPPEPSLDVDTLGLAHPGTLPGHWTRLEEAGVDLEPMLLSAERFLQLWQQVDNRQ